MTLFAHELGIVVISVLVHQPLAFPLCTVCKKNLYFNRFHTVCRTPAPVVSQQSCIPMLFFFFFCKYFQEMCCDELTALVPSKRKYSQPTRLAAKSNPFTTEVPTWQKIFYSNSFFPRPTCLWNFLHVFGFPNCINV